MLDGMFQGSYHGKQRHAPDFGAVLQRALAFGVRQLIITAGTLEESIEAAELARKLGCFSTVGCHPTRCKEFLEKAATPEMYLAKLRAVAEKYVDVVVAVGECGLDYDRLFFCPKDIQLRCFPLQIMLAAQLKLPLFLHNRNTGDDFIAICTKYRDEIFNGAGGGVVHSFTGGAEELSALQALGFYISLNGCSFKEDAQLGVARMVQLNRLMLETDAPWCSIKPTHASHRLLSQPDVAKALDAAFKQDFPDVPPEPPCRKVEKYEAGACVKDRCEPWECLKILKVMYALRRDEVPSPFALAEMCYANTMRLFGPRLAKAPPMQMQSGAQQQQQQQQQTTDEVAAAAAAAAAVAKK